MRDPRRDERSRTMTTSDVGDNAVQTRPLLAEHERLRTCPCSNASMRRATSRTSRQEPGRAPGGGVRRLAELDPFSGSRATVPAADVYVALYWVTGRRRATHPRLQDQRTSRWTVRVFCRCAPTARTQSLAVEGRHYGGPLDYRYVRLRLRHPRGCRVRDAADVRRRPLASTLIRRSHDQRAAPMPAASRV
jgi:hypothetical protein